MLHFRQKRTAGTGGEACFRRGGCRGEKDGHSQIWKIYQRHEKRKGTDPEAAGGSPVCVGQGGFQMGERCLLSGYQGTGSAGGTAGSEYPGADAERADPGTGHRPGGGGAGRDGYDLPVGTGRRTEAADGKGKSAFVCRRLRYPLFDMVRCPVSDGTECGSVAVCGNGGADNRLV